MSNNQQFKEQVNKALTTTGDGAALLPYDLDPVLTEELLKLQPLAQLLEVAQADGKTHEYNVRSSHPMGWFEGETTPSAEQNSVYARKSVQMKIQRIWGSVSGFAQAFDEAFIDALATELEGSLEGMANILEFGALWGVSDDIGFTGDAYQYSGIVPRIFAYAPQNVIDAGGDKITLDDLDAATAAASAFRAVRNDPRLWLMGVRMKQIVDGLQTKVQIPLTNAVLNDGKITMAAYANQPILETDYVVPASTTTSPTPQGTLASGGAMTADVAVKYRISSVTAFGEQVGSVASDSDTPTGGNLKVNLAWTADPNAKLYMIWRQDGGTGAYKLLDIINAKTYNGAGTVTGNRETYTDDGSKTRKEIKPLESGEQNIVLINRNPRRGASFLSKIDDMGRPVNGMFSFVELARVKDTFDYMIKGYLSLKLVHPNLVAIVRHAKLA